MSEYISMQNGLGQANISTLTLLANSLNEFIHNSRKFNLTDRNEEEDLSQFLLQESLPNVIIKIVGIKNEKFRHTFRASIQKIFKQIMCNLMEQTNIWLLNGTREMLDLEENERELIENDEDNPNIVICKSFGKSQIIMYHSSAYQFIDIILSRIQQQPTSSHIPIINLLIQGDDLTIENMIENISKRIPTIILKGTGMIANQIAALYEPMSNIYEETSNEQLLSEKDLHRLINMNENTRTLMFVCQPGKDELDESILRAISTAIQIIDKDRARIRKLSFAMRWNKINYAQIYILNHNTIINWTDEELDKCLEMAIVSNVVPFVELLFEYGASLERLALISDSDLFKIQSNKRKSQIAEFIIETIPIIIHLDSDKRVQAYVRLLFYWAIENHYFELAMSICTRLEDSIIAMLLVSQWCQYKELNDYTTSDTYRIHRRQFDMYAADILDLCYDDNKENTIKFLHEKSILYHDQQSLVLIDDLCSKTLVSTDCMQSYMNTKWYGTEFHQNKNFIWEILICLVCICPILLFIPIIHNRIFQRNKIDTNGYNFWSKITNKFELFNRFYHGNAVIRFHYNMASYTAFLILFSYTILFDYFPLNIYKEKRSNIYRLPIPLTEIILHIFLASIALEEIRQVFLHVKSALIKSPYWKKLSEVNRHRNTIWSFYRNDPWNVLDFVAFTLWIVGFITRFIVRDHAFEVSKICMSIDLCLWYMRCLHVFLASERLGPKLLMIFHTMKDLMSFLFFILIFLSAYAITTYSLITTSSFVIWTNSTYFTTVQNGGNLTNIEILRNIIEWGTWKIFGSTSLTTSDSVEIKYTAKNDAYGFVTLILTIAFLVVAYVLLLNNLIALFNFTIQRVHGESHRTWCYHFYVVLKEYEEKDMFVPPLNLCLWPISYYMRKRLHDSTKKRNNTFIAHDNYDVKHIRKQQQRIAEKYWKEKQISKDGSIHQRPYVCRQCKCRGTEADYIESTFL
ncbi:unnamed protein product [Adineta steineri]|uniref:Ion transport domain-containing protein n=1 Tax=Adineta steineri TaxID=433720 RepID=A0A818QAT6_9BILA|nr:unnamed protein product [Adineta steineri]